MSYPITTVPGFGGGVVWTGKRPAIVISHLNPPINLPF
jgi:hypothetical protein